MATGGKGESLPKLAGSGGRRGASDMLLCAPVPKCSLVNGGSEGAQWSEESKAGCLDLHHPASAGSAASGGIQSGRLGGK